MFLVPENEEGLVAYRLELPDGLRTQFKGMTAMNGTNMKDALIHFIEWYVGKQQLPPENKLLNVGIGQKEIMQPGVHKDSATIPELMNAYILLNYKGIGEKQLVKMANDCQVTPAQVQAVLGGQPVNDFAARVFSDKLKMSFEDFVNQYPVVKL
ncbi:MAG: hypothetical protein WA959_30940 [Rivularia sp. (in: cyanobacteria)]